MLAHFEAYDFKSNAPVVSPGARCDSLRQYRCHPRRLPPAAPPLTVWLPRPYFKLANASLLCEANGQQEGFKLHPMLGGCQDAPQGGRSALPDIEDSQVRNQDYSSSTPPYKTHSHP
jgi:hypothetical protein